MSPANELPLHMEKALLAAESFIVNVTGLFQKKQKKKKKKRNLSDEIMPFLFYRYMIVFHFVTELSIV